MKIAIQGCTHGELEKIYDTIQHIEDEQGIKVDLLISCGDFQSTRNLSDLKCMACPDKYKDMCTFYKYYSGEAIAPVLTLFIGGNHEASNYLQELAYGGWVAPNIYYLGYAGVVNINGIRIAGLSGIFKGFDYLHGHHEKPPYDDNSMRSCYHIRNIDVFRLKQLSSNPPDIMLSHDWPRGVTKYGNAEQLIRFKKHFKDEIEQDKLGSSPTWEILETVKPAFWFAAHLHCKFAALVEHEGGRRTKFLALDKCLPGRRFLQVLDIGPPVQNDDISIQYDADWLAILKSTNHLISVEKKPRYTPGPGCGERYDFTPTPGELENVKKMFDGCLDIPYNFAQSVLAYKPNGQRPKLSMVHQPHATVNSQTTQFCQKLGIQDPMALLVGAHTNTNFPNRTFSLTNKLANYINEKETNISLNSTLNPDEISIHEEANSEDEDGKNSALEDNVFSPEKSKKAPDSGDRKSMQAPLSLPAPQLDEESEEVDLASILNTQPSSQASHLFFIDKGGDKDPPSEDNAAPKSNPDTPPVKKLKRRNAAMYSADD
eukprot:TRINITY_DN5455_c1_g1_i9.p1 TRINITY_DN5455_c1_g1~~TRINITY_DN5455_c1_g1_i9.p1  ORF type:complete len:543 (-),score=132.16 TRINITY_DN5455_c1_g1_i9:340-1968(-)